jgi:hypothetical protein
MFGTSYIPEIPRMEVAERSEYWNKDGRMLINKGAEIGATITFGGMAGSRMLATQPGRFLLGTEAAYNLGAGIGGKDITKTDENGDARQMPLLERGLRVTGGLFGARSVINAEIAAPNSAVNKLDDIFKNNTPKPRTEAVTPNGFRVKVPQTNKPLQAIENPILEMRGRGGYETNEITDKLGTKIPKVRQPFEISPSLKPNSANKPLGESEKIRPDAAPENIRGLTRQNETAETLAKNGYKVEQKPQLTNIDRMSNPWLKAEKKPDFKVEGEIFDVYTPSKNKLAENIRGEINSKIEKGQTRRIALNMDDSQVSLDELKKVIWEKPIPELEQILVVKDGKVTIFFPFK